MKESEEKIQEPQKNTSILFIERYLGKKLNGIDLKTLSELPDEFFTKFVQNEDFGQIPKTLDFVLNIKRQSPFDRILSILSHIVDLQPLKLIYSKTQSFLTSKISELKYNQPKSKDRDNELYRLIRHEERCKDFLLNYYDDLGAELQYSCSVFKSINLLKSLEYLIESNSSVINQNNDCLILSPMLFPYKQWSQLIIRELSLIENKNIFKLNIEKFTTLLEDFTRRIGLNRMPSLESRVYNISSEGELSYELIYKSFLGVDGYNLKISKYLNFLNSLEFRDIEQTNLESLSKKIIDEEKRKEKVLQKIKNSKIKIFKHKNHVKKGMKYLLKKTNPKTSSPILEKVSIQVISELFHYGKSKEFFKIPDEIVFSNQILLEYIIFLEKYEYIKYNSKVSIPKVISHNCSLKMKGLTQSNLYNILKNKIVYHPDNIQNIKLTFTGSTSEIALLNEMKN